ncbi:MAG TPA: hypothetical protein VK174_14445, partial [Chitinophagales bacterium]|nr:hypothetical protein [Chitinophagales bacterium]
MASKDLEAFLNLFIDSVNAQQFSKLTLSDKRDKSKELKNVFVKPVMIKNGLHLSFVYRYPTKDVTKNYDPAESRMMVNGLLEQGFLKADMFTTSGDY